MAALTAAARSRVSLLSPHAGPSLTQLHCQQTRAYAAPVKKGQTKKTGSQSFKGGKGRDSGGQAKREKRLGSFRPMPVVQLKHPVFATEAIDELQLPSFDAELVSKNPGKAMQFPLPDNDAIRIFGVPRNVLVDFRILSKPASVVRDITVKLAGKLQRASQQSSEDNRIVLAGTRGSGKSYLLLQAVEYAASAGWMVLYIPRAINLVNSTSAYTYDPRTQTYQQPVFAYQTLQRFLTVNATALGKLSISSPVEIERRETLPVGTPLKDLIDVGLKDQSVAPTVLEALLAELGRQQKYPVLLAIDDFQALFSKSTYRDPHFAHIKAWHLSMPRLLLQYASGQKTFARGAVIGALSSSNTTFALTEDLRYALGLQPYMHPSPYAKVVPELAAYTRGISTWKIPERLTVDEAAALFEVWNKDKSLHTHVPDEFFMAKYSESGGNARDFVWRGLLATLET
ncbi:hypothetical protein FA95DRAFT_1560786 [Auriscalpium vulgare]|uniref:Uncharacterized protein n=1 Tax=Auriscalpium vulgare TaxID=40419 RepID=A0ACB8RPU0_9AGAM|nr:hypothetical protein FA95DRAFT_1560786 [Auriscalpium vulgare]